MQRTTLTLNADEVEALRQAILAEHSDDLTAEEIDVRDKLHTRLERALDRMGC